MDFRFGEREEALRREIRQFAEEELPPGWFSVRLEEESRDEDWERAMSMAKKLSRRGWLTIAWPKQYGGQGASLWEQLVYNEAVYYWGIPGVSMGISGVDWVGPSLILFGSEEQKKKYLPLISSGEPDGVWCTGYSEPNAGSDFANIQTRAVRDGDEYVINGQKIWTSAAHRARWCWLAARTDFNVPKKHHGISIFIVDMKSPGVNIKPLLNYAGYHIFNEVFFDDVRVPASDLVGEENKGWWFLMRSLAYERSSVGSQNYGSNKRILDELVYYVKENQLSRNPLIRHKLVDRAVEVETLKMLAYETTWKVSQSATIAYEAARDKSYGDDVTERLAITGTELLGVYSQVDPHSRWVKIKRSIQLLYWFFLGMSIAAGTDDIEKNVVAQFGLGLPRSY